jgi:hypothetical protein
MNTATVNALFIVVAILVVGGLVTWIVVVLRRASRITRTGNARLAAELHSAARNPPTAPSPAEAPATPRAAPTPRATPAAAPVADAAPAADIEARLARLDGLHARGVITDRERAEARAKILAE